MPEPLIQVRDVAKSYDDHRAILDGVTFSVDAGAFLAILGKSGCGKTTLLNIIGGLDRPTRGDVVVDGQSLGGMSEDSLAKTRISKIGFVFQEYNLLQDLTVRENVALPLILSGRVNEKRVEELLRRFDIERISSKTANRVSGGEAQRAAIARAMANNPKIILADEPTGNLDSENAQNVVEMFQLARRDFGTAIVLATHDGNMADQAKKVIRLVDGRAQE